MMILSLATWNCARRCPN